MPFPFPLRFMHDHVLWQARIGLESATHKVLYGRVPVYGFKLTHYLFARRLACFCSGVFDWWPKG